jgi:hypothetical protein
MSFLKAKEEARVCPGTGKIIRSHRWVWWFFPFTGLAALIWFLVRVIPKPSRATYPCQRVAFPLASGLIVWLLGLAGSAVAYHKAKRALARARYVLAAICIVASVAFIWSAMSSTDQKVTYGAEDPRPANDPIGVGKGVYPGRVAWIYDPNAATWPGSDNNTLPPYWYSNTCTNQQVVSEMLSKALRALTGESNDSNAWNAIFHSFNQQHNRGDVGYTTGEKIAIKINMTLTSGTTIPDMNKPSWYVDNIDNSPQLAIALLKQLTDVAGVSPNDISIGDPGRIMPNHWYNMVESNCPGVVYLTFAGTAGCGRTTTVADPCAPFYWSDPCSAHFTGVTITDHIPTHFAQATYFINFPILKSHDAAGITVCGKNFYGSLIRNPNQSSSFYNMHWTRVDSAGGTPGMGHYRAIVDLMGHPRLGGKTLLALIDGLYSGISWDSRPIRWQMAPFNGGWPSSIFLSQDPIAADSVAYDFLYTEWTNYPRMSGAHDYLHEAAEANNPPSGAFYDPNHSGSRLASLGVHEHWNDVNNKQYSRNLDPVNGTGIELVARLSGVNRPLLHLTGKGDWIHYLIGNDGNNALSNNGLSSIQELVDLETSKGVQWLAVKWADGNQQNWNNQFTQDLINRCHTAGLKIYAWVYVYGGVANPYNPSDVPGEIQAALGAFAFSPAPDGLIIYWDDYFESLGSTAGASVADQYCQGIRAVYPGVFMAHAPIWKPSVNCPEIYRVFNNYCDVAMPRAYCSAYATPSEPWLNPVTPTEMVSLMNADWNSVYASWQSAGYSESIKPIAPLVWGSPPSTGAEVNEFVTTLETIYHQASPGGYNAVSFWDADAHTPDIWSGIASVTIGAPTLTSDLNNDGKVNFADYALLAAHWKATACEPPEWCNGADLDKSGVVNIYDLAVFCENWLQ